MNAAVFLSMSLSGGGLILLLFAVKGLWGRKLSRQWCYYIWLAAILRLLLPFGAGTGQPYRAVELALTQGVSAEVSAPEPSGGLEAPERLPAISPAGDGESPAEPPANAREIPAKAWIWALWLAVALGMLVRKVTVYQSFVRYVMAGAVPVSDVERLDQLAAAAERLGVKRPVELCVNPLIASPVLAGVFRPCIVLPGGELSGTAFSHIVLHELIHYRRGDALYKWLTQVTVCVHWFNPLVHWMGRELARACEFSCDEAVLTVIGSGGAQTYGTTLLDAMAAVGKVREPPGVVALSGNKQLLKERLEAIMRFKKPPAALRALTGALTLCVLLTGALAGVRPASAADQPLRAKHISVLRARPWVQVETCPPQREPSQAERYYEAGSVPLFEGAFSRLEESAQEAWLETLYGNGDFAFFSAAVRGLDPDSPLRSQFAEKAYTGGEMAFFSTLAGGMDRADLERWLDRALADGSWAFQSMLYDRLDRDEEWKDKEEAQNKAWAEAQAAEYRAAGVTMDGKEYYYQGQLVDVFLDIRADQSFYTLDRNPRGTVNIRIVRNERDEITGVAYLTEAELAELFEED